MCLLELKVGNIETNCNRKREKRRKEEESINRKEEKGTGKQQIGICVNILL